MNLRARSLYAKIFLWFCLTVSVSTVLVFLVAGATGSQPFGRRYMEVTQELYARTAVDLYTTEGEPALRRYLVVLQKNSQMEGHLIEDSAAAGLVGVFGEPVPAQDMRVLQQARSTGISATHFDRHFWTAASVVASPLPGTAPRYIFLLSAHPLHGLLDGAFFRLAAPRIGGGLLLAALLCLLLARHITRPVRLLEAAAKRMAEGDLGARTLPAMRGRNDELASMAAAFDSMAARIETLVHTQRQMLADISHELRSPLTRIGVSLELLRRGATDVLEPMQADLDRLNALIGQVLELARFELQQPGAQPGLVDLVAVLEDVVRSANHEGRGENKSVQLGNGPDCLVRGEQAALHSCLENIVRNALQHSRPGGVIRVGIRRRDADRIEVRVDDSGPGVPEESLPFLFVPFFRVPGSAAHPHGSGLGLSISERVARRCGGAVEAVNLTPHGLSVRLTLPSPAP